MIRVLLADDEAMVRAGVRAILETDDAIEVVAEAADGREAVDAAQRHRPDVALLDVTMPRMDGLAAAAEIARTAPETARVILTTFSEDAYIARALGDGTLGAASLDVFEVEPLPQDSPLWALDNCLITPHIAAASSETTGVAYFSKVIQDFEAGHPLPNVVDRSRGY